MLLAVLGGWLAWGRQHSAGAAPQPYSVAMDCMGYSTKTGRVLMRLTFHSLLDHPFRLRGHVIVSIRHDLPPKPSGAANWTRYADVSATTPLVIMHPGQTYTWSRYSRPVLLNGSTRHLENSGCTVWALPPRLNP